MEAFLTICPQTEGKMSWTDFEAILRRQTGEELHSDELSIIQKAMASIKVKFCRLKMNEELKNLLYPIQGVVSIPHPIFSISKHKGKHAKCQSIKANS